MARTLSVGESLVGEGNEVAHIDLIVGSKDGSWRVTITKNFAQAATEKGDNVRLIIPEGANHFDVVHAHGPAYPMIANAVASMLGLQNAAAK